MKIDNMTALEFVCASWVPEHSSCKKKGTYTCKNCHLVIYCSPTCQKSHWPQHKRECRSPLGRETWQPAWVLENRTPSFMGSDIPKHFGAKKYLWGNTPALDVLQLESNEGKDHAGDLRILFAASGDLRNIVKTVARLPRSYSRSLEITINDKDFDIVARNIILLLITLVVENVDEAVDCMIHLWYSTLVRESDIGILESRVRPLIDDVCQKVKNKAPGSLLAKTWTFGLRSLRVVLEKSSWDHLLSFTNKPAGLTAEQALKIRATNALAKSRIDYRDRYMCCLSPLQRIAFNKFRQDGLLLPFGFPRREFNQPNPTFFQTADTWPMNDSADPLNGWSSEEIANTSSGAATADIYGKLFFYIRGLLRSFLDRLSSLNSVFKILRADASSLPDLVDGNAFSRVEVSNISDAGWLGIHDTLRSMVPLLQTPLENPHATLITLFLNAVEEAMTEGLNLSSAETKRLFQYIPPKKITSTYDPMIIKFQLGQDFVASYEHIFNRYMENFNFHEVANFLGATMKKKHTIIDRWPYELKLRPGQPGAQEEFDQRIGRGLSGKERYVEWNRTHESMI